VVEETVAALRMIIKDEALQMVTLIAVVDLQTVAFTMIVLEDLTETIMIKISLAGRKSSGQDASMMTAKIVGERGARI